MTVGRLWVGPPPPRQRALFHIPKALWGLAEVLRLSLLWPQNGDPEKMQLSFKEQQADVGNRGPKEQGATLSNNSANAWSRWERGCCPSIGRLDVENSLWGALIGCPWLLCWALNPSHHLARPSVTLWLWFGALSAGVAWLLLSVALPGAQCALWVRLTECFHL